MLPTDTGQKNAPATVTIGRAIRSVHVRLRESARSHVTRSLTMRAGGVFLRAEAFFTSTEATRSLLYTWYLLAILHETNSTSAGNHTPFSLPLIPSSHPR